MGSGAEKFEDLRVWQEARQLVVRIYSAFGDGTPAGRDFGFRDQIRRASVSVMSNIAEGFERCSTTEFARFLDIAKGSSGEVRSLLWVAEDLGYMTPDLAGTNRVAYTNLSKGIAALARHLRK